VLPFLLLGTRDEDAAADNEYAAFLGFTGLEESLLLAHLLDEVVARDFPFLGACYGIGVVGTHEGGTVDRRYAEPISRVRVSLTPAGRRDPLLVDLPGEFEAFVGHKEAVRDLPVLGLCTRIEAYKHAGYFEPHQADSLKAMARRGEVVDPPRILTRFVRRFARA
jgi:GMP synthase (glutamine-hydrolysing)